MIHVRVRAFAALRDALGFSETTLAVPDGARIADLLSLLDSDHPAAAIGKRRFSTAVNRAFAGPELTLSDGDEVALIPPVSGG